MRSETSSIKDWPEMHRIGHTCANLNGELFFVWGGSNENVDFLSAKNIHLWIYETLTGYWRHRLCSGDCPPYLSGTTSTLIGQRMFVFGGHSTTQDNWLNCLYCLDLETFVWRDLGSQAKAEPTKPIRSDKCVSWSYDNKLYVFGGYGWSQTEHLLELLDKQKDLQLTPDHRWPKFGWNNQLVEFDLRDNTWRWPSYAGKCPSARAAHSGALMGSTYYLFGGRDSRERLNDLYTFNMKTFTWNHIAVFSAPALGLSSDLRIRGRPVRHLLDSSDDDDEEADDEVAAGAAVAAALEQRPAGEVAAEIEEEEEEDDNDDSEDDDDLAGYNNQAAVQMQEVNNNEQADTGNPTPSPSYHYHHHHHHHQGTAQSLLVALPDTSFEVDSEADSDDPNTYQFDEYPHPAHLLERWSLSTHQSDSSNLADNIDCQSQQIQTQILNQPSSCLVNQSTAMENQPDLMDQQQNQRQQVVLNHQPAGLIVDQHLQQPIPASSSSSSSSPFNAAHSEPAATAQAQSQSQPQLAAPASIEPVSIDKDPPVPVGRSFSSFTQISDHQILLFGGISSQEENLDDCWIYDIEINRWTRIELKNVHPRLWHTGSRTKNNEVVIIGGSCSDKIDEFCTDVLTVSLEPKSLKRLALDSVVRSIKMRSLNKVEDLPSTVYKLIKLRKQAMALGMRRFHRRPTTTQQQ